MIMIKKGDVQLKEERKKKEKWSMLCTSCTLQWDEFCEG